MLVFAVGSSTSPVTFVLSTTVHVYVVLAGTIVVADGFPLAGVSVKAFALQIVSTLSKITGFGFTVIVIVKVDPTHKPVSPDLGVTV